MSTPPEGSAACLKVSTAQPIPIIESKPTVASWLFQSGKWRQFSTLASLHYLERKCSQSGGMKRFLLQAPGSGLCITVHPPLFSSRPCAQMHRDMGEGHGIFGANLYREEWEQPMLVSWHTPQRDTRSRQPAFPLEQKLPSLPLTSHALSLNLSGWNHANVDSSPRPHPLCYCAQPGENGRWACRRRWKMARNGCLGTSSLVTWLCYPFFTLAPHSSLAFSLSLAPPSARSHSFWNGVCLQ